MFEKTLEGGASLALLLAALGSPLDAQTDKAQDPLHVGERVPPGCVAIIDGATVSQARFITEMVRAFGGPGRGGSEVRKNLVEETIVMDTLRKRGLSLMKSEVEKKISWIKKELRKSGKALDEYLKSSGVPRESFERKLRSSVALEKLVRMDLKIPANKAVGQDVMNLWLLDHREKAVIIADPKKLDPAVAFTVNDVPVLKRRFVKDTVPVVAGQEIRKKVINPLLQELLAERILKVNGLTLTEADIMLEWQHRKNAFEKNPANKNLEFEQILGQQTAQTPAELRRTPGFRVRSTINLMGRRLVTPAMLLEGFEKNKGFYGPRFTVRHVFIRATAKPDPAKKLRSFGESEMVIRRIHEELAGGSGRRFEDAVRLYSEHLETKFKGGRLASFTPKDNRVVAEIVQTAMKMEVDTISDPIKTRFGWHILYLEAREPVPGIAEVEPDLRRRLGNDLFASEWAKAKIGVDVRL